MCAGEISTTKNKFPTGPTMHVANKHFHSHLRIFGIREVPRSWRNGKGKGKGSK